MNLRYDCKCIFQTEHFNSVLEICTVVDSKSKGLAISFLGIHKWKIVCSVVTVSDMFVKAKRNRRTSNMAGLLLEFCSHLKALSSEMDQAEIRLIR
jgi:hypothetical protein